jgi:hypothetical protein
MGIFTGIPVFYDAPKTRFTVVIPKTIEYIIAHLVDNNANHQFWPWALLTGLRLNRNSYAQHQKYNRYSFYHYVNTF